MSTRTEPSNRRKRVLLPALVCCLLATFMVISLLKTTRRPDWFAAKFSHPPREARLRAYWWWLNGNVTPAAITRDLQAMAAKGFGGALICDAGGAEQDGNDRVPHGPTFFSPQWRELYKHALHEADRLGLEMSLNIQSGWNLGGPMVSAEDAPKRLVWSETSVTGPTSLAKPLPEPRHPPQFYRDIAVIAYPLAAAENTADSTTQPATQPTRRRPIQMWLEKSLARALGSSAPDTSRLLEEIPGTPGEEDFHAADAVDLTAKLAADGSLSWEVPAGNWMILRFGCTLNEHCRVSTCSEGWDGYALDPFDREAFDRYWQAVVEPLIADAGPLAGRALKYLHTDSWEVEVANWTPTLREEFQRRRGYDLWPFLPALAGRIVDSRAVTNRLLFDFRKTMGDLAVDHHYQPFVEHAHRHGLQIHPESGGPHAVPIDSLRCLGMDDAPMSEFWARSWRHRVSDEQRFFVKQPASAAHTYGHRLVLAEGFTTIGPHWQETLWDNLKPSFDRALCEGLNLLVWHSFVCSPQEMGMPGQQYFAGTHFNPNCTWWPLSAPVLAYFNRCQYMLQQGLFVADAVYYYGDNVPNFTQLRSSDPLHVLPSYDYDVATEEVVLTRMSTRDGRIVLPDGMSYRVLVLPNRRAISLRVLRKLEQLVSAGATVIGPKPESATGLQNYPACDDEVIQLAARMWADCDGSQVTRHRYGRGRIICGERTREILQKDGIQPDFEFKVTHVDATQKAENSPAMILDYIHRRTEDAEIYFVCNRTAGTVTADTIFRVHGKRPELWDPITGSTRELPDFQPSDRRTAVPLQFAPYGSWFVVFRKPARHGGGHEANFPAVATAGELTGPWTVHFDPAWGGPGTVEFPTLVNWTQRPEEGIHFYSGTATYEKHFDQPAFLDAHAGRSLFLDLGEVHELAHVRLNGHDLGVVWAKPFRVEVTGLLQAKDNRLEIEVVNFWPNRIIGDASLPPEQRHTRTNIRKLTADTPLMASGLLGPVTFCSTDRP